MAINVLIADDSAVTRSVILKILRLTRIELGEVHQAGNGRQAMEVLAEHWIDAVFLDINMPVMNGEEFMEIVRQNPIWADLPIVVVSTEGSQTRIEHLENMGAKFIHKPFPPEMIRNVVLEITGMGHELQT